MNTLYKGINPLKGPDASQMKVLKTWFDLKGKRAKKEVNCFTGIHGKKWFKELLTLKVWLRDEVCYFMIM